MAMDALSFLGSLDMTSVVLLFWYTTLIEIPRYAIGAIIAPIATLWLGGPCPLDPDLSISIILVGHNEERALRACVQSLGEQTILGRCAGVQIIVVDDGSTDRMSEIAATLQREGKVNNVLKLAQRGGKSAGVNLALSVCRGDIVVICDIDTTFDRDALVELVSRFSDPKIGAVSGNLGVRNSTASFMTRFQTIEYAIGLSLGRCIADSLGTLSVVSGAFGAFRLAAIESVGRQDVEVGEDADLTMKLRSAGWQLRFAPRANALTDVPETVAAFIAQRLRWDRGLITIWTRKFRRTIDPRQSAFRMSDAMTVLDVIFFQVVLALAFPVYVAWLFYYFGLFAQTILAATLVGYAILDCIIFVAAAVIGIRTPFWLVLYLPLYTALQISLVRVVRLIAIAQEVIFRSSYRDPYVPRRVMSQAEMI
jgi:cellulose synthase/poly-beta-1,6-N-acetylglucosamine synthase-like glycosyltransferase